MREENKMTQKSAIILHVWDLYPVFDNDALLLDEYVALLRERLLDVDVIISKKIAPSHLYKVSFLDGDGLDGIEYGKLYDELCIQFEEAMDEVEAEMCVKYPDMEFDF